MGPVIRGLPPLPRFKKIYLEITNRCNLACAFCAPVNRRVADLSLGDCATLLPRLKEFTDHLALHVLGEPLLHQDLAGIMALCQRHALKVNLTTNGTLLPQSGALLLSSKALRQINISLHSVMGRSTAYDPGQYLSSVLAFARAASVAGIFVSLRLWDRPRQVVVPGRWQEPVLSRLEKEFGLTAPLTDLADGGQGAKLAERIFLSRKELFDWPDLSGEERGGQGYCLALRDHLAILADGTVVPCCLDAGGEIPLGNILDEPLAAIITGDRARKLRDGFCRRQVVEKLCRRCGYRERF